MLFHIKIILGTSTPIFIFMHQPTWYEIWHSTSYANSIILIYLTILLKCHFYFSFFFLISSSPRTFISLLSTFSSPASVSLSSFHRSKNIQFWDFWKKRGKKAKVFPIKNERKNQTILFLTVVFFFKSEI